jgi:hypothetical protein
MLRGADETLLMGSWEVRMMVGESEGTRKEILTGADYT